jgi:mono/diheme cytochrome c family protein
VKVLTTAGQFGGTLLLLAAHAYPLPIHAQPASADWTAPARAARKQNPVQADPKSLAQGKEIYTAACLPCHGPAGKGDGPAGTTLERNGVPIHPGNLSDPKRWAETDGALFWKLTEGKTPMPAWGETLSEEQRWSVINYVRTLAPKPAESVATTQIAANASPAMVQPQAAPTEGVWTAPARAARKENPVPPDAKSIAQGKAIYITACLPCHGTLGKGDGPAGTTLERNGVPIHPGNLSDPKRWEETDGALFWKLTEGKTPMPAWGETLSEEQRWAVINYIRTLAPKTRQQSDNH